MLNIILAILAIIYYMGAFLCFSCLLPRRFHGCRPSGMFILGFLMYFAAFHLTALPMKLLRLRLHVLSLTWFGLLLLLLVFVVWKRRRILAETLANLFTRADRYTVCFLAISAVLVILLVVNVNHISDFDASHYIGLPLSSRYSDTIELMNPYSGRLKDDFRTFYQLNTDTVNAAVIYQVLRLHPLVHAKFTFTAVACMVFCLLLYKAGMFLAGKKYVPLFAFAALVTLLFSYSIAGVSQYFAYRTYEGKAVCAYLYTAAIFAGMLAVFYRREEAWGWACLFFAGLGGVSFCNTALFVIPLMTGTLMLPTVVLGGAGETAAKLPHGWRNLILVLLPCAVWLVLYMVL